jgi:predicted enzyme related to lactoylglutathione lyase
MAYPGLIVVPVSDIARATATYTAVLGIEPYYESPYYVGFRTDNGEIGLDPNGKSSGPLPYWDVDDLTVAIGTLTAAGATVTHQPEDVGGGLTIAVLADTDGNPIGLRHASNS